MRKEKARGPYKKKFLTAATDLLLGCFVPFKISSETPLKNKKQIQVVISIRSR